MQAPARSSAPWWRSGPCPRCPLIRCIETPYQSRVSEQDHNPDKRWKPITSPAPLATVADVQARTQIPLTAEQQARAAVLVGDASAIIRARVPDLPDPPPATAPGVIATAVLRALATPPDGNKSETVGAHSRVAAHEGGGLYLTDDEVELLRPPAAPPRGAFSIWTT